MGDGGREGGRWGDERVGDERREGRRWGNERVGDGGMREWEMGG